MPAALLFSTCLINSIKHEHSCKILYITVHLQNEKCLISFGDGILTCTFEKIWPKLSLFVLENVNHQVSR